MRDSQRCRCAIILVGLVTLIYTAPLPQAAAQEPQHPAARSIAELSKVSRPSIVVINTAGRTGQQRGVGSGFVVRADGVIATNFHVIGRGRGFTVQFADGKQFVPTELLAFDRAKDLALVKIEADGLPALPLGDSTQTEQGQPVFAIGNPLGFQMSVTTGVISEKRDLDGKPMIQVDMSIEPGSSGSPLMDRQGRVLGIIAIKSPGTTLGFAVPINELKSLIDKPHPIKMASWLTIGTLDARDWEPIMGGRWRQRAGRIVSTGSGGGFGGRTLCLSHAAPPVGTFELAVDVRLEDESGAAGLAFHSDGADRHYGFYPTNGALRLTRFNGPDVYSWTILQTVPSEHYRPGQWNTIKVRVAGPKLSCYVNEKLVIEAEDEAFQSGRVGLVKFREPTARFRRFRMGPQLMSAALPPEEAEEVISLGTQLLQDTAADSDTIPRLARRGAGSVQLLRDQARQMEQQAARLRDIADRVHRRRIEDQLRTLFAEDDNDVDLIHAALLLAKLDNEEIEIAPYQRLLQRMADDVRDRVGESATGAQTLEALIEHMSNEWGFHGSRAEYYHRSNSYINEVLDDREGLPLTLSMVFLDLAGRLELPVSGIGIPSHFVVRYQPTEGEPRLIDVFNNGKTITREQAEQLSGRPLADEDFAPVTKKQMIVRMLRNLRSSAEHQRDLPGMLRYLDVILALDDAAVDARGMRALLRYQSGQPAAAAEDLDWLLEHEPPDIDLDRVRQFRDVLRRGSR